LALLVALFGVFTMTGCNTLRGAGEDVENAGDAVKDAVD
jgi:predicted small secreted protein